METYVVRPGGVLANDRAKKTRTAGTTMTTKLTRSGLLGRLLGKFSVRVDELAAVMVDLAVNGGNEQEVVNKVIVEKGRELLINQSSSRSL